MKVIAVEKLSIAGWFNKWKCGRVRECRSAGVRECRSAGVK